MPPSSMGDLFAFLTQLMTEHASLFETIGLHMFRGLATIMIAWFGIKCALASAGGGQGSLFHMDQFASLLMAIAFGFGMITYYSQPLPGVGVSFYHLIIDEGLNLSNQLNHSMVQEIWDRLSNLYWGLETPVLTLSINILEILRYAAVAILLIGAQAAVFGVVAFGYIAMAIAVLVGPVFIPFFIVPGMEWIFWGWFKSLIQYAFYPVVANAYVYVFGSVLIHFGDAHPGPYDSVYLATSFFPLTMLLGAFIYGILKIPSLVNSLFTGRSGDSAIPNAVAAIL